MMRTIKYIILTILIGAIRPMGFAQDSTAVDVDSTIVIKTIPFPWAISIEAQFESNNFNFDLNPSTFYGMGLEYKRLLFGFYYRELISSTEKRVVFPNNFSLHSSSGGGYLGYRIVDKKLLGLSARVQLGSGDILWRRVDNETDFVRDVFTEVKPEILLEFEPTIITQLYIGIGYKHISDFDIPSFNRNDISGITITGGIKLGFFYKKNEEE
jgi:hypothetical protein